MPSKHGSMLSPEKMIQKRLHTPKMEATVIYNLIFCCMQWVMQTTLVKLVMRLHKGVSPRSQVCWMLATVQDGDREGRWSYSGRMSTEDLSEEMLGKLKPK